MQKPVRDIDKMIFLYFSDLKKRYTEPLGALPDVSDAVMEGTSRMKQIFARTSPDRQKYEALMLYKKASDISEARKKPNTFDFGGKKSLKEEKDFLKELKDNMLKHGITEEDIEKSKSTNIGDMYRTDLLEKGYEIKEYNLFEHRQPSRMKTDIDLSEDRETTKISEDEKDIVPEIVAEK